MCKLDVKPKKVKLGQATKEIAQDVKDIKNKAKPGKVTAFK